MGELANVKRILIIKPSSLGDILHVFPALEQLYQHCPKAKLDFLINPAFADLLDYSPFPVTKRILFERKKMGRIFSALSEFLKLARELRREKYDLIIDFQGLARSAIFSAIAKGGPVVGFAQPREKIAKFLYNHTIAVEPGHAIERNNAIVKALTGQNFKASFSTLPANPAALCKLKDLINPLPDRLITLIPGARWQSKKFPPALFANVAREIHQHLPDSVFATVGTADDQSAEQEIIKLLGKDFPILPLAGETSLKVLVELLRASSLVISNDTGPMHIAAALERPTFAFFGPTNPEKTGPYGKQSKVYQSNINCIQCMKRNCRAIDGLLRCHQLDARIIAQDAIQVLTQPKES